MASVAMFPPQGNTEPLDLRLLMARAERVVDLIASGRMCWTDEENLVSAAIQASILEDRQRRER